MDVTRLKMTDFSTIAQAPDAPVINVGPYYIYEGGIKTDKIGGYAYTCVLPELQYEKVIVKVPDLPPVITADKLTADTRISFQGFFARPYRDKAGNFQLSCKAEKAILVNQGAAKS